MATPDVPALRSWDPAADDSRPPRERPRGELPDGRRVVARMAAPEPKLSPSQELMARVMRIVRTCPEAASEVLELMFLVSRIEALTTIDREYRDARRVVSRLRHPLWDMGPTDREKLLAAAETIRRVCRLGEDDIPAAPTADAGERARIEARLAAALSGEFDAFQIARVTGAVAAALQE